MTRATLRDVLDAANAGGYAVAGLVCLGWEDARAYVAAAEAEGLPVILQAGPAARRHMPIRIWGAIFAELAEAAKVPVVSHLDHGRSVDDCAEAIAAGFSSVMFDGSQLPLEENIRATREIVEMAHAAGVSCEGEIGFVGYAAGAASQGTDPEEAARFAAETGVDAMAISVGNTHLQRTARSTLDRARIKAIEALTEVPLVIHGGSGVAHEERRRLAHETRIAKFNIGTELRAAFGAALRDRLLANPALFDRIEILSALEPAITEATRPLLRELGPDHHPG